MTPLETMQAALAALQAGQALQAQVILANEIRALTFTPETFPKMLKNPDTGEERVVNNEFEEQQMLNEWAAAKRGDVPPEAPPQPDHAAEAAP